MKKSNSIKKYYNCIFFLILGLCNFSATPARVYQTQNILIPDIAIIETINEARTSDTLVTITFHFNAFRFKYLEKVLLSLSTFPRADIILITNTIKNHELKNLEKLYRKVLPEGVGGGDISIRSYPNLEHPFDLTWCHKEIITNEFLSDKTNYSHFIYLEDDISFNYMNFSYFLEYRKLLRDKGLLPSFLRVEYRKKTGGFVNTDNQVRIDIRKQPYIQSNDLIFVNPPNPYTACFVLDKELAAEYIESPSFGKKTSSNVVGWEVRERAAMGLTFEAVPPLFQSRYVVPVSISNGRCPKSAWIFHLPNNYANDQKTPLGKIPMDSLFILRQP
jgi:hypothetical protein